MCLSKKLILRCYFSRNFSVAYTELHGVCDASELAYAAIAYLRLTNSRGYVQVSLVASKTKVAPLKHLKALCHDIRAVFSKLVSHVTQPHPID